MEAIMSNQPIVNPAAHAERATKKPYHSPHLEDFGAVNELTRTSLPVTYTEPSDSGTFPNAYNTSASG